MNDNAKPELPVEYQGLTRRSDQRHYVVLEVIHSDDFPSGIGIKCKDAFPEKNSGKPETLALDWGEFEPVGESKFFWARPGDSFFGGRGVLIPLNRPVKPAPTQENNKSVSLKIFPRVKASAEYERRFKTLPTIVTQDLADGTLSTDEFMARINKALESGKPDPEWDSIPVIPGLVGDIYLGPK